MTKFIFMGALICVINAVILLVAFDSVGGFLLGVFGFVICLICSSLISNFAE